MYYFIQINEKRQKILEKRQKEKEKAASEETVEVDVNDWYDVDISDEEEAAEEKTEERGEVEENKNERREFWSYGKSSKQTDYEENPNDGITLADLPNDYKYRYYSFEEVKRVVGSQERFTQLNLQRNKYVQFCIMPYHQTC